ncbi:hypothetical protein [Metabacillus litoralis]|uniref:hypothetical protein n=1 Tax=Metabacillus litoralis TaxID=152268 RepID=UPI001CFC949E|nr:hypothetical protein [Metabacillus litoralis]
MGTGKVILIAIMAGIYSGIMDHFEYSYEINNMLSNVILTFLIFMTAYLVSKSERTSKPE